MDPFQTASEACQSSHFAQNGDCVTQLPPLPNTPPPPLTEEITEQGLHPDGEVNPVTPPSQKRRISDSSSGTFYAPSPPDFSHLPQGQPVEAYPHAGVAESHGLWPAGPMEYLAASPMAIPPPPPGQHYAESPGAFCVTPVGLMAQPYIPPPMPPHGPPPLWAFPATPASSHSQHAGVHWGHQVAFPSPPYHLPYPMQQIQNPAQEMLQAQNIQPPAPPPLPPGPSQAVCSPRSQPHRLEGKRTLYTAAGRPVRTCVMINKLITSSKSIDAVMSHVENSLHDFDAVCMATALHTMAAMREQPTAYKLLGVNPNYLALLTAIERSITTFTPRNLANTIWALAKMNLPPPDELYAALDAEILKKIHDYNAQNIANTLWGFATLSHNPGEELLKQLVTALQTRLSEFTPQNISNTVMAYAKLEFHPGRQCMQDIAATVIEKIPTFTAQALSNTLWAFSHMEEKHAELLAVMAVQARARAASFNAQNVANTLWAYANLNADPGCELLDAMTKRARSELGLYSSQNISNILWSFAKFSFSPPEFMAAAVDHIVASLKEFTAQSMANTVWAIATLNYNPGDQHLQAMANHSLQTLETYSPQNISNTLWAFATLGFRASALLQSAANMVAKRLGGPTASAFSRQHLSNMAWTYATLDHNPGPAFLSAVAKALIQRATECNPQEVSNAIWAYAKLRHHEDSLMDRMAEEAIRRIDSFSQQNLANLTWAFGKLSYYHERLLQTVAAQVVIRISKLSLQHISNVMWTYASFLYFPPGMIAALVAEVRSRLSQENFNAQQLSNLLWSLCISQKCEVDIWAAAMHQFSEMTESQISELPEEALTQIFQAFLLLQIDYPGVELRMPQGMMELCQRQWKASCLNVRISQLHREVTGMLQRSGFHDLKIELLTEDELFSIDIALPEEMIAIEVDGPHHFTHNTNMPLGEMKARKRLLEERGWEVISVPYFKWSRLKEQSRRESLLSEIQGARVRRAARYQPCRVGVY